MRPTVGVEDGPVWEFDFADVQVDDRRVVGQRETREREVCGEVCDDVEVAAEQRVLRADSSEALGIDDFVYLCRVLLVNFFAVVLVDAHDRSTAVVRGDDTGRVVHVQVAGEAAEGVRRIEVCVVQYLFVHRVAFDDREPLVAGTVTLFRVDFDDGDVVPLLF